MYFWTSCLDTISINFIHIVLPFMKCLASLCYIMHVVKQLYRYFHPHLPHVASWSLVTCVDLSVVELEDSVRVHLVRETSDTQHTNTMLARIRYRCSTVQYSTVQYSTSHGRS